MRVPARCNQRRCQARRNLNKRLADYKRRPRCHMYGCPGYMHEDKDRVRGSSRNNQRRPVCKDPQCPVPMKYGRVFPHRYDTPGCIHYVKYTTERNTKPRSKYCPLPESQRVPF